MQSSSNNPEYNIAENAVVWSSSGFHGFPRLLLLLLSISLFLLFSFFLVFTLFSCPVRAVD